MVFLKLTEIRRDTSRFQFRSTEFDETRVQWLVENWNASVVDPLDVWRTVEGDFLLSGHHRIEAALRRGVVELDCRVHELSLEEAQTFALKSNANRLQYSDYEYARCIAFLRDRGSSYASAANEMAISVGMAKKYYYLRHLLGTDWERQSGKFDLTARAFEIGSFCEVEIKVGNLPFSQSELQSLFQIVVDNDLTTPQLKQLLRDIKKQREKASQSGSGSGSLFDLNQFSDKAVKLVKERNFLDQCSAQAWWLYELMQKPNKHEFPPELKASFECELKRFYAYCVGSDDPNAVPIRAGSKGRKLRVSLDDKAS